MSDGPEAAPAWFCVRSQIKHEHIAAGHLRQLPGVDVFCPRVRFQRATRRGKVWFTEAMFPNYLFARFGLRDLRIIKAAHGVAGVVHFGDYFAPVPDEVITDLRTRLDETDLKVFPDAVLPGDEVVIADGTFMGITAVVQRLLPAKDRVRVLLEFLGRPVETELASASLVKTGVNPRRD
ncbi:MAG: transcription termination/antitermination NusG family protein [Limisphaerales bacterium]